MASESATVKGKKAVGKRGHPAAVNMNASRTYDQEVSTVEEALPPQTKKRRVGANAANSSPVAANVAAGERKSSVSSPAQTSPTKPNRTGTRATPRGRNAKAQSPSPSPPAAPQKAPVESKQAPLDSWTNDDLAKLIDNLVESLPKTDNVKYSTQVDRMDWGKVKFADHSAEECKKTWGAVMTKLRRYRTLTELATDAKQWVKQPWISYNNSKGKPRHPDIPKKPLTPYFRYFLEKRAKCSTENPKMSMTDLAKMLAKKFQDLPDKKKQKYKDSYEKENEKYKIAMEKFREDHPEVYENEKKSRGGQGKQNGPAKAQTPVQFFLAEKMTKHLNEQRTNKKEIEEKYKKQWKNLSDNKKCRWIKKSMVDEERYAAELGEYRLSHPDFPEQKKSVISKAEKEIKDKIDGKPDRPPNSGYSLYSKIMLKELKDFPSKEKMGEISRRWKELSEKERHGYATQATEAIERYQQDYKLYVANLTEDERKKLEEEEKRRKKKPAAPKAQNNTAANQKTVATEQETTPSKPKKPMSALFFYQQEKLAQYKSKNPDRSEQELTRQIAREYGELSEKKKEKYKKMAEDAKKTYQKISSKNESEVRAKILKSEPKKPPQSGYSLFTSELMSKLTDIESKLRMAEVSKRWAAMKDGEKEKYKKQATELGKKYQKDIQKFLSTLSEDEQKVYQQIKSKKPARKNAKSQAAEAAAVVIKQEKEDSSNSSDEESSKEGKGSSSSDSESGSGSDSSSESGSESDSDSDSKSEDSGSDKDDSDDESDDNDGKAQRASANSSSDDSDGSNSGSASDSDSEEE